MTVIIYAGINNYGSMFPLKGSAAGGIRFETVAADSLNKKIRAQLPKRTKNVRMLRSMITKHVFFGTLDEIKPSLILEAQKSGLAAVLVSDDGKQFSLVYLDGENDCPAGSRSVALARKSNSDKKIRAEELCL